MKEDKILMTSRDRKRLHVLRQVLEKRINQQQAARVLGISDRQIRRQIRRLKKEGDRGIMHRLRDRPSNAELGSKVKEKVLRLCKGKYEGFGPKLANEQIAKSEEIIISDETLRLWMRQAKIEYRRRKERPHRRLRQRRLHAGEMLQMDGSHHDWLEGRGPWLVLMGYIDDATNRLYARFYDHEGTLPAMDGFKRYARKYGIPCSVYLDRHTTYKSNKKLTVEEELEGIEAGESQFQRAMKALAVEVIHANSPQAKGRIERVFRTLQDRLVKEMRIQGISDYQEANRFLETYLIEHNRRYAFPAAKRGNLHRAIGKQTNLDSILSVREPRKLRNDFTVQFGSKLYQVEENLRARDVVVEHRTDGSLRITDRGRELRFREIEFPLQPKADSEPRGLPRKRTYTPQPSTHPWHRFHYGRPWKRIAKSPQNPREGK